MNETKWGELVETDAANELADALEEVLLRYELLDQVATRQGFGDLRAAETVHQARAALAKYGR